MELERIDYDFSICKVTDYSLIRLDSEYIFLGKTDEEKSLVCITTDVPPNITERDDGWRAFRIQGELDFSLIGILSQISGILAENKIGIFVVSTFNTDYVLTKKENYEKALDVLSNAGYAILNKEKIMEYKKTKSRMPQVGEAVFCIGYLIFDLIAAVIFFVNASDSQVFLLFGILTLVLGGGDAFHLVPRIIKAFRGDSSKVEWWSGLGLMVSSITMTVFYVVLFYVWKAIFPQVSYPSLLHILIMGSAVLRIVLCLFPQNNWFRPEGNPTWGLYRNLPFAVTGLCLVILFFLAGNTGGYGLWMMSIAIIISFACYFPVVLWAKKKPMFGMLMMPKTMAYIWMICMGLGLIGK